MYKAVIFDLDGTLFDTLPDIGKVLNFTLEKFNLPTLSYEEIKSYIGNGARELVRLAIGENNADRLEEILAYYREVYAQNDGKLSRFFKGEREALERLKNSGVSLAILTNKPHGVALKTVSDYFSDFPFACVIGQREHLPLKPAPDGVYAIAKQLNVQPCECVFVGDGETDVETAKNAGVDCICVLWGYRKREQLEKAGGKVFAKTYKQLADMILM